MTEIHHLKNVIFFQTIISFVPSRKIINIYIQQFSRETWKCYSYRLSQIWKTKKSKLKLDIDFLSNCKQLGVYRKFCIFKLLNFSDKDASLIRKRLLCSAINNCSKELQHVLKELNISKNFIFKQLSTIDFYILKKSITSHNKKSLQKSLYAQHKKLSLLTRGCSFRVQTNLENQGKPGKVENSQNDF